MDIDPLALPDDIASLKEIVFLTLAQLDAAKMDAAVAHRLNGQTQRPISRI